MNRIKNFFIFIIISILVISLTIGGLNINIFGNKDNNVIKIVNHSVKKTELDIIKANIINKKKPAIKIKDLHNKLDFLILRNINFYLVLNNKGIIVTKKEMIDRILNIPEFNKNSTFSSNLYKNYLKKNNLSEISFQRKIRKISLQKQIKSVFLFINDFNNNSFEKLKIKHRKVHLNMNMEIYNKKINKIEEKLKYNKVKYIDISIKNIINNIKIKKNDINKYHNANIKNYFHKVMQLEHCFMHNTNKLKKKKIKISKNEINKNIEKKIKNNNLIIETKYGTHLFTKKELKTNILPIEIIKKDIVNKCKRIKAKKYIKKNISGLKKYTKNKNKKMIYISKKINLDIKNFFFPHYDNKHRLIKKKYINRFNNNINCIKINTHRHIIFKIGNKKKFIKNNKAKSYLKKYFNKILSEKKILKDYLKIKNNKTIVKYWDKVNKNEIFAQKFDTNKNYYLKKNKNLYYIIKNDKKNKEKKSYYKILRNEMYKNN